MGTSDIPRDEAEAALAARRELGPDYEDAVVESFTAKLDEAIERRVAAEVQRRLDSPEQQRRRSKDAAEESGKAFVLALASLGLSIPLIGVVTGTDAGTLGVVLVLLTVILVNLAFNLARLRR
ncbi:MAG TPA: hypothetical protein VFZ37_16180 [Jiangellaceae bacterium]